MVVLLGYAKRNRDGISGTGYKYFNNWIAGISSKLQNFKSVL